MLMSGASCLKQGPVSDSQASWPPLSYQPARRLGNLAVAFTCRCPAQAVRSWVLDDSLVARTSGG